jgi:hypothetical protein
MDSGTPRVGGVGVALPRPLDLTRHRASGRGDRGVARVDVSPYRAHNRECRHEPFARSARGQLTLGFLAAGLFVSGASFGMDAEILMAWMGYGGGQECYDELLQNNLTRSWG